jgi:hypothetical protein
MNRNNVAKLTISELAGLFIFKRYYIEQGHTDEEWLALGVETEKLVNDDSRIAGFYASCQVAGVKP